MKKNRNKKLNIAIGMTVVLTLILLSITAAVLAMYYAGFLPGEGDTIFLVPRDPDFEIGDEQDKWSNVNSIEIFEAQYHGDDGSVTVQSAKGDSVIAPGTGGSYTFYLKNEGNVALDYSVMFTAKLTSNNLRISADQFPILFRMYNQNGDYVIGDSETWVSIGTLNEILNEGIVGKGSYYYYTLEWNWPYESGNDGMDTYFGTLSSKNDLLLTLDISSYAEESLDPNATGGEIDKTKDSIPSAGEIKRLPFAILVGLALLALLLLPLLIARRARRRRRGGYGSDDYFGVLMATMTGVGSALSVMFYRMFRKKK